MVGHGTTPDPAAAARADLIRRDFTVDAAAINSRWCGDITLACEFSAYEMWTPGSPVSGVP